MRGGITSCGIAPSMAKIVQIPSVTELVLRCTMGDGEEDTVKIAVRMRPFNKREKTALVSPHPHPPRT